MRPIAVASIERLREFPELPTVAETLPGFRATGWQIVAAPIGTPDAIVHRVSEDLAKVVVDADLKQKLAKLGSYSRPMSPDKSTAFVKEEQRTWQPVLQSMAANAR